MGMEEYEDIIVQSNLDGYYTKRKKKGEIEHNHRKVTITEVVWDIDTHNKQLLHEISNHISAKLAMDNISHSIWDTSRSYHIHSFFSLSKYEKEARRKIRKLLLRHYSKPYERFIDFAKTSEDVMIRDFNCRHEITGKKKLCTYEFGSGLNAVPDHILKQAIDLSKNTARLKKPQNINLNKLYDFLQYCLSNRFDADGGRNQKLFKNIAIACYLMGISQGDVRPYFNQIADNCRGKRASELMGWFKWCYGKQVEVNWKEVKQWYGKLKS